MQDKKSHHSDITYKGHQVIFRLRVKIILPLKTTELFFYNNAFTKTRVKLKNIQQSPEDNTPCCRGKLKF